MKITYHGHSCFTVSSQGYDIVLDPFSNVPGLDDVKLEANAVFCSHEHGDHAFRSGVEIKDGLKSTIYVSKIGVFHDDKEGQLRGRNDIHILSAEGKRVVHLGDLGHALAPEIAEALGDIDVLMIPVGGFFTIDAYAAADIARQLNPKMIIPMHYRDAKIGYEKIGTVEDFISLLTADEQKKLRLVKGYGQSIEI